jgi:hypothetical protein
VLSGRGLCVGPITRPRAVLRECGVSECDRETTIIRRPGPLGAVAPVGGGGGRRLKFLRLCNTCSSKEGSIQASSCAVLP